MARLKGRVVHQAMREHIRQKIQLLEPLFATPLSRELLELGDH